MTKKKSFIPMTSARKWRLPGGTRASRLYLPTTQPRLPSTPSIFRKQSTKTFLKNATSIRGLRRRMAKSTPTIFTATLSQSCWASPKRSRLPWRRLPSPRHPVPKSRRTFCEFRYKIWRRCSGVTTSTAQNWRNLFLRCDRWLDTILWFVSSPCRKRHRRYSRRKMRRRCREYGRCATSLSSCRLSISKKGRPDYTRTITVFW